ANEFDADKQTIALRECISVMNREATAKFCYPRDDGASPTKRLVVQHWSGLRPRRMNSQRSACVFVSYAPVLASSAGGCASTEQPPRRRAILRAVCGGVALASSLVLAQPSSTEKAPDTIEERMRACAPCHGEQGQGVNKIHFPPLAGKPAGYLFNQLVAFRDGRRKYTPMNYLLAYLPDLFLRKMGEYFAAQKPSFASPARPVVSAEVLKRGEDLGRRGDRVPACVACHGP